jgi:uncharacterized protein YjbI with pentapeptide repeats
MADEEQLRIQGFTAWETWRQQAGVEEVRIGLSKADLRGANLSDADLSRDDRSGRQCTRGAF